MNKYSFIKILSAVFIMGLSVNNAAWAYRQPAMEDALRDLYRARESLTRALPNKGGHREKALRQINRAINEINLGIDYANRKGEARGETRNFNGTPERKHFKEQPTYKDRYLKEKAKQPVMKEKEEAVQEPAPATIDKGKLERRY